MAKRINKLITNDDFKDAVDNLDKLQKVSNSINKIIHEASPSPYDGHGFHGYCHYYNPSSRVIPIQIRETKYMDDPADSKALAIGEDYTPVRATQFDDVRDYIKKVSDKVKKIYLNAREASGELQQTTNQINYWKAIKNNIDAYISSEGKGATIPTEISGFFTHKNSSTARRRARERFGDYVGWNAGQAQADVVKKIKSNQDSYDAAKAEMASIVSAKSIENLDVEKTELMKLEHLQALLDASSSINRTMSYFNKYYDVHDRCATTCQVYCQQACQNSCQNNCTCHDQKCGTF